MDSPHLVVISGLPASGKTTVGRVLAHALSLTFIDKDQILEAMFDSLGCSDRDQRQLLSRASDEVVFAMAAAAGEAVLVNWWNHDTAPRRLQSASGSLIEVFCDCPLDVAAARFTARTRHPGHLDRLRTAEEHEEVITTMRHLSRSPRTGWSPRHGRLRPTGRHRAHGRRGPRRDPSLTRGASDQQHQVVAVDDLTLVRRPQR